MSNLLVEAQRAKALTEHCGYCHQEVGQRCLNPRTGLPLEKQAAHRVRIHAADSVDGHHG